MLNQKENQELPKNFDTDFSQQNSQENLRENLEENVRKNNNTPAPLSLSLLLSMKKSGLNHLLFNNEDRRDFCSYSFLQSQLLSSQQHSTQQVSSPFGSQQNNQEMSRSNNDLYAQKKQNQTGKSSYAENSFKSEIHSTTDFSNNFFYTAKGNGNNQQGSGQNTGQNLGLNSTPQKPIYAQTNEEATCYTKEQENLQHKRNKTLSLEKWPEEWKKMHTRFSLPSVENTNSQVRVAWTYAGLEQDALGVANKERQAIMKQILLSLNHKKGTHSFIPFSLPTEDGLASLAIHEEASFFWSAMRLVKPRILLLFGSSARDILQIPKLRPLQKMDMGALRILQMHKPETLVAEPTHLAATLAFLQDSLRICIAK